MHKIVRKVKTVSGKSMRVLKTEGPIGFVKRSGRFVYYRQFPEKRKKYYRDILFIDGNTLPHPTRYRVDHQMEQLRAGGMTVDSIFYDRLNTEMLKYYHGFVFFRCPITDTVRDFIKEARHYNKTCFFDIDDLVIDQKYTDQIKYVKNMMPPDKAHYDDGVNRMRATMQLCDYAITTTERLQHELQNYIGEVFINRNVASDEMVRHSFDALRLTKKEDSKVIIGYFSGSITHNENFALVLPSLVRLFDKHPNLYLKVAGILDIPTELDRFKDRLILVPFADWRTLPIAMANCDINIAPLVDTIFNEAKSENKWTEASLVKVVTAASNIGAFKTVIENGRTGILVDDSDWYRTLDDLIVNPDKREEIANTAHKDALENHTTIGTGGALAAFIRAKLARSLAYVLPSTDISGGINVVLKHAEILRKRGWDVSLLDAIEIKSLKEAEKQYDYRHHIPGYNVITLGRATVESYFDTMVATLWTTVQEIKRYPNTQNRKYFVQNYETNFYVWGAGEPRTMANATYADPTELQYITMSLWCQRWLQEKFGKSSKYASNGIDLQYYPVRSRDFLKEKIHILVEGDSKDDYKNTDEAFRIISLLDPNKFEISYLSYRKTPKDWYRVDHFYNRIAPEKVGEIYSKCDILLKTSLLESFSYPPLEMMATGGLVVVVPNDGNREYLRDGENCLFYEQGNINDGIQKVERLLKDTQLRSRLVSGGLSTAKSYEWKNLEDRVAALYN